MPSFILELLSEEIPARMQDVARQDLVRNLVSQLATHGIDAEGFSSFSTPRRLCVMTDTLASSSAPTKNDRRGPRVTAPEQALSGFLRSTGKTLDQLDTRQVGNHEYYFSVDVIPGQPTEDLLPGIVYESIDRLHWQKSMRWGSGRKRWVRPLRSILCLWNRDGEPRTIDVEFAGVRSGNGTCGHRFMSPGSFTLTEPSMYRDELRRRHVIVDQAERREMIVRQASALARERGLELVADNALIDEITGLVEWPMAMIAEIDPVFRTLPSVIIISAMRNHQRYLSATCPETSRITHFLTVANRHVEDDTLILSGNLKVLNARLADAQFFLDNDLANCRKNGLDGFSEQLKRMIYHRLIGTQFQRTSRIESITVALAEMTGVDAGDPRQAARYSKADLVSEIVTEFPDLQGKMGKYLADRAGCSPAVANAIEQHYLPAGQEDPVPNDSISLLVGIADRINHLAGMMGSGEKPSGSRDPHALRRAATGLVRILVERELEIDLPLLTRMAEDAYSDQGIDLVVNEEDPDQLHTVLLDYIGERFRSFAATSGYRVSVVRSCMHGRSLVNLMDMMSRIRVVDTFISSDLGPDMLHVYNRVHRMTGSTDKTGHLDLPPVNPGLFVTAHETRLWNHVSGLVNRSGQSQRGDDLGALLRALAEMRASVDDFFDNVLVNADDPEIRANRLGLLVMIVNTFALIADFSQLEHDD